MADFDPPWAVNGIKRAPTVAETDGGFPCGPADRELFNWLFHRVQAELNAVILGAGLTPSDADLAQVWKAIQFINNNKSLHIGTTTVVTIPPNCTQAEFQFWAAGGGGGGTAVVTGAAASGGGGGEYRHGVLAGLIPGDTLSIIIGAPGTGGAAGGTNNGTAGGTCYIRKSDGITNLAVIVSGFGGTGSGSGLATTLGAGGSGGSGGFGLNGDHGEPAQNYGGSIGVVGGRGGPTHASPARTVYGDTTGGGAVTGAIGRSYGGGGCGGAHGGKGGDGGTAMCILRFFK